MKRLLLLTAIFLTACGPSQEEKEEIAIITCNIMGESRNMDGSMRIREINAAREKIGEDAFLGSDEDIKTSLMNKLCKELVLNNNYEATLNAKLQADREAKIKAKKNKQDAKDKYRAAVIKKVENYKPVLTLLSSTDSLYQPNLGISCTNGLAGNSLLINLKGGKQINSAVPFEDEICDLAPRQVMHWDGDFQFDEIESVQIRAVIFEQQKEDVSSLGLDLDQETIKIMNSIRPIGRSFAEIIIDVSISDN
tara:strand:- start:85 stop:837 length:753 start_codon:yes stop_codon:yes gene_type:complete